MRYSFWVTRLPGEEEPIPVMGVGEIRIEFEGTSKFGLRRGEIKQAPQRASQSGVSVGRRRINLQSFLRRRFCFGSGFALGYRTVVGHGYVIVGEPDVCQGVAGI